MEFSIGVTAEQAKALELNDENFICPPCQGILTCHQINQSIFQLPLGISCPSPKRTTTSETSTPLKRKHTDETFSNLISPNHATKHLKPNIILERIIVPIDVKVVPLEFEYQTLPSFLRNHQLLVLFPNVRIMQNTIGFTVHLRAFVVIPMKRSKMFNKAKEKYKKHLYSRSCFESDFLIN